VTLRGPLIVLVLLLTAGTIASACSSGPSATSTSTTSPLSGAGGWTHFTDNAPPTDLPASCRLATYLPPVAQTPTWPTGFQILDAVSADLVKQFPTIYGGLMVAPAKPGESAVQVNSHFIVLETERDPTLETEVRSAYPAAIGVIFALAPRSMVCLNDVASRVNSEEKAEIKAGVALLGAGIRGNQVVVEMSACSSKSELADKRWFSRRWGTAVSVRMCLAPAVASPAYARQ
jgi:hypothetical protein